MKREEAINVMQKYTDIESGISKVVAEAHEMAIKALEQEPKTGHWCRGEKDKHGYYHFHCSECGEEIQTKNKDFCDPYCCMCGAKMESEE